MGESFRTRKLNFWVPGFLAPNQFCWRFRSSASRYSVCDHLWGQELFVTASGKIFSTPIPSMPFYRTSPTPSDWPHNGGCHAVPLASGLGAAKGAGPRSRPPVTEIAPLPSDAYHRARAIGSGMPGDRRQSSQTTSSCKTTPHNILPHFVLWAIVHLELIVIRICGPFRCLEGEASDLQDLVAEHVDHMQHCISVTHPQFACQEGDGAPRHSVRVAYRAHARAGRERVT